MASRTRQTEPIVGRLCQSASRIVQDAGVWQLNQTSVGQRGEQIQDQNHLVQDDEFWSTVPPGAILLDRRDVWPRMGSRLHETAWSVDYKRHGKSANAPFGLVAGPASTGHGRLHHRGAVLRRASTRSGLQSGYWDGPPLENIQAADADRDLAPLLHGGWRAGCRPGHGH